MTSLYQIIRTETTESADMLAGEVSTSIDILSAGIFLTRPEAEAELAIMSQAWPGPHSIATYEILELRIGTHSAQIYGS